MKNAHYQAAESSRVWVISKKSVVSFFAFYALAVNAQVSAPGVSANAVQVSAIVDLSGPLKQQSTIGFAGTKLAFDEANEKGGVEGRLISLRMLDDQSRAESSLDIARKLEGERSSLAIVGSVGDDAAVKLVPFAEQQSIPYIGAVTGITELRKRRRNVFFIRPSYRDEARKLLEHARTLGSRNVAIIYQSDGFGESIIAEVKLALEEVEGIKVVRILGLKGESAENSKVIHEIGTSDAQAVIVGAVGKGFTQIVRALRESKSSSLQIYGFSVVSPQEIFEDLGPVARGVVLTQCMPAISRSGVPMVKEYQAAHLKAALPFAPNSFTFEGYFIGRVVVEALRRSGKSITRDRFVQAVGALSGASLGGIRLDFKSEDHTALRSAELAIVDRYGRLQY